MESPMCDVQGCGLSDDEVFVSDGSKCDLARFQTLWNEKAKVPPSSHSCDPTTVLQFSMQLAA